MNIMVIGGWEKESDLFLSIKATNIGSKKTTITNALVCSYDNWWQLVIDKPTWNAIFVHSDRAQPLPYVLDVGHDFFSRATQTAELEDRIKSKYFYAGVSHSFDRKPRLVRVKYVEPKRQETLTR